MNAKVVGSDAASKPAPPVQTGQQVEPSPAKTDAEAPERRALGRRPLFRT